MPNDGASVNDTARSEFSRRHWLTAVGGAAGLLAGCSTGGDGGPSDDDTGGTDSGNGGGSEGRVDRTLRSAIQWPPDEVELNRWARNENSVLEIMAKVGAWSNHYGKYVPIDAKEFNVDLEKNEFRIELHEDLYWHQQGEEIDTVTAEDFAKQKRFARLMVPENARSRTAIDQWTAPDDHTVVAKLKSDYNDELIRYRNIGTTIDYYRDGKLLGDKLQALTDATSADEKKKIRTEVTKVKMTYADKPLSGLWTHEKTVSDEIRFKLFDKHWNADNVNFTGWKHTNFGTGSTGEKKIYQAYVNDELDYQNQGWQMQKPAAVPFTSIPDHLEAITYVANHTDALMINYRQPWADPMISRESLPTPSAYVRQGLAHALDPATAMSNHYGKNPQFQVPGKPAGMGKILAKQTLGEETYSQLPTYYEKDFEKAAERFRMAGLEKEGDKWVKPNGKPLTVKVNILPWYDTALRTLTGNLENFGVVVDRETGEGTELSNKFWATRKYGAFIINYGHDSTAVESLLMNLYTGPPDTGSSDTNRAGLPPKVKVPPFGKLDAEPTETVDLEQYWNAAEVTPADKLLDEWAKKLAWVYAYHLPAIPLVGVANMQMVNTKHFEWPKRPDVSKNDPPHSAIADTDEYPPAWSASYARWFFSRGQDGAGGPGPVAKK